MKDQQLTKQVKFYAWVVWLISALFYAAEFFQRVAPGVIAEPLAQSFHINHETLGFVISFYFWAYGIAQLPVGMLIDKYGARFCLSIAAFAVSLGTILFAMTDALWVLALARIVVGIGSAFAFVGCLKLAHFWFDSKLFPLIVGLTNTLGVIGGLFGEAPLSYLVSNVGWQKALVISALFGIFVGFLIILFVRDRPVMNAVELKTLCTPPLWASLKAVVCRPQSWLISIYAGIMVAPVIAFGELWAVEFIENHYHFSVHVASGAVSAIFVGIAIGGPLHGLASGLFGRLKLYMGVCQLFATLALFGVILLSGLSYMGVTLLLFAFGLFVSSMLLSFPLHTRQLEPHLSGIAIALTNMVIMITGSIFQPLIGRLMDLCRLVDLYGAAHFDRALMILPIMLIVNYVFLFLVREGD